VRLDNASRESSKMSSCIYIHQPLRAGCPDDECCVEFADLFAPNFHHDLERGFHHGPLDASDELADDYRFSPRKASSALKGFIQEVWAVYPGEG